MRKVKTFGEAAVEPLIGLLGHQDWVVRDRAAHTLGMIGPPAKKAVPALIALLELSPFSSASYALAKIGDRRGLEPVLAHIHQIDVKGVAEWYGAPIVPGLVRIILDPRTPATTLQPVVSALGSVPALPADAVTPLVRALAGARPPKAASAHSRYRCRFIIEASSMSRWTAILEALEAFGTAAAPAVPQLRRWISDPDPLTRHHARRIIVNVTGPEGADALRFRVDELIGTDWLDGQHGHEAQAHAASALAVVLRGGSPCDGVAAPAIFAEDDGTRLDARLEAVRLLGRLESPAAIPPLIEALHFPDPEINRVAAEGLERRGPAAAAAASALEGVARTHWSRAVAKAAAAAHFAIAGTAVEVPAAPPSVPYERGEHRWDVLIGKETRRASDAPDPNEETRRGSSPPLRDCERLKIKCEGRRWKTLRAGEDSLALIDVGEFGSFVIARGPHTDEKQLWSELDLIDLFRLSGDYFLLTKAGRVVRLVPPRPPGEWTAQLVTVLPGSPRVWEILPDALLVVVLENSPEPLSDPQTVAAYSVNAAGIVMRHPLRRVPGSAEPAPAK